MSDAKSNNFPTQIQMLVLWRVANQREILAISGAMQLSAGGFAYARGGSAYGVVIMHNYIHLYPEVDWFKLSYKM